MKIITNLRRRRQEGLTLLVAVILFVLFLIFVGTIAYVLWKAIQRLPRPQPPPPDGNITSLEYHAPEVAALTAEVQSQFGPNAVVTPIYAALAETNQTVFIPFGTNEYDAMIYRSIDTVNWQPMESVRAGQAYLDRNPPPTQAFYRRAYPPGAVITETNHTPGFYRAP